MLALLGFHGDLLGLLGITRIRQDILGWLTFAEIRRDYKGLLRDSLELCRFLLGFAVLHGKIHMKVAIGFDFTHFIKV